MKNCAIVVWYNPTIEHVDNLNKMKKNCDNICIVDNSSSSNSNLLDSLGGVNYILNKNIGGIARAFNLGFEYFINEVGCDAVYTFDQDSVVPDDFFDQMNGFVKIKKAEIACPNYYDINAKAYATFTKLTKFKYKESTDDTVDLCISSGMYISTEVYEKLGGFDERYIIDHVDTEFALKAYANKIPIYLNRDVCLEHAIGHCEVKKFLGKTIKPNHHPWIRKYYGARNGTYAAFKFWHVSKGFFVLNILRMIGEYLGVILYERDKLRKVHVMNKGLYHAIIGKLDYYE